MDVLPGELIKTIFNNVSRSDLKNLRQVCKALYGPATRELFSHVHVTSLLVSQVEYNWILLSSELSKYIRSIHFDAEDGSPDLYTSERRNPSVLPYSSQNSDQIIRIIKRTADLQERFKVQAISLTFSPEVRAPANRYLYGNQDPGTIEFQTEILTTLFTSLLSIANVPSLAIQNLLNINDESLTSSSYFYRALERLTKLSLGIATEQPFSMVYTLPYLTTFFSQLPSTWISHSPNLTSLTLSCDTYWGFIFGCDFRFLHLPYLKTLELGKYTISHDSQLNWILSHGNTLKELVQKDVIILSYVYGLREPDCQDENNATALSADTFDTTHAWAYPRCWRDTFSRFKDELPKLKYFELGSELEGPGIFENRYTAFHSGNDEPFTNLGQFVDEAEGQEYGE